MKIDIETGWLSEARIVPSPNQDERPEPTDISGIVLHNISLPPGEFGGTYIESLFLNQLDCDAHPYFDALRGLKVSSHVLITRQGEVVQFVPFIKRAWHAGVSEWDGRQACNDFTIGIELEGDDDSPFLAGQYRQCALLIKALIEVYPLLNAERVTGHQHIAPGRKTDPGPYFNWRYLQALIRA